MTLLQKLSNWQKHQASREGVEGYRVVQFKALQEISQTLPKNEQDLLAVKGIGPAKVQKYGADILALVAGQEVVKQAKTRRSEDMLTNAFDEAAAVQEILEKKENVSSSELNVHSKKIDQSTGEILAGHGDDMFSVGSFLAALNILMSESFREVRIKGEATEVKHHHSGHVYFMLKDSDDGSILRCAIFRNSYEMSGVRLEEGMEVIVIGTPSHHKQYGFSFIASSMELFGEGALKKAYDELKKKFEKEGLFAPERKRTLPELPQKIGLITSRDGAAIGDFTTNVGAFGYKISFHHTSVEGQKAVREILAAIKRMGQEDLDLLAVVRGGGSLESLQAFNNENVVRALSDFPVPVIAGIGHEQDETLSTLVADVGVSTPTAAARAVRESWDGEIGKLAHYERTITTLFDSAFNDARQIVDNSTHSVSTFFENILSFADDVFARFTRGVVSIEHSIDTTRERLDFYHKTFLHNNPERQLKLGYSIARDASGGIIRTVADVKKGDNMEVSVSDGKIKTEVQ